MSKPVFTTLCRHFAKNYDLWILGKEQPENCRSRKPVLSERELCSIKSANNKILRRSFNYAQNAEDLDMLSKAADRVSMKKFGYLRSDSMSLEEKAKLAVRRRRERCKEDGKEASTIS